MREPIPAIYEGNGIIRLSRELEDVEKDQQVMVMVVSLPISPREAVIEPEQVGFHGLCQYLEEYENKYGLSSADFYGRFLRGEMGDSGDFILWAGAYEIYQRLTSEQDAVETVA
jgi:hypothetical protein